MRRTRTCLTLLVSIVLATPAHAQRRVELGVDASAIFGLGSQSSVDVTVPGARFRMGFFQPGSRISIEPAAGFSYDKVSGTDGVFTYNLELGALYHFRPLAPVPVVTGRVPLGTLVIPYVRPFVGVTGFSGGGASDHEFSVGAGLGTKLLPRPDLGFRFEANLGYGFTANAARIGLLAGLSFFPR